MTPKRPGGVLLTTLVALFGLSSGAPMLSRPPATKVDQATVTIHGRAGTFGSTGDVVPSGQTLTRRPVPGWAFPPGQQAYRTALAADGTVFMAGIDHNFGLVNLDIVDPTSDQLAIATYEPRANTYTTIRLRTTTGRERAVDQQGRPSAASIADLEPVAGGRAMAFTARPAVAGQDPAVDGMWPAFGLLTKVNGRWQVARGSAWANQWTEADLGGTDPASGSTMCTGPTAAGPTAAGPIAGAPTAAGRRGCGGFGEMAGLPGSGDLIVGQQVAAGGGRLDTRLVALRPTGPDGAGRFTTRVTGHYVYPQVRNPGAAGNQPLKLSVQSVQADPTSRVGDERFLVTFRVNNDTPAGAPHVVQEFSYDAGTGRVRPVSPPFLPGDRTRDGKRFFGYHGTLYDNEGNLWAVRLDGLHGGKMAIYAKADGARAPGGAACPYDPARPMDSYVTTADGRTAWGQACRPDYDLLQTQHLLGSLGLVEDPVSHDVASLSLGGNLMPIRRSGSGRSMTFRTGNIVDLGRKLLPTAADNLISFQFGVIGADRRLWLAATHARPRTVGVSTDQWLYSVDVAGLFAPEPIPISDVPGRTTTIQAEQTVTTGTTQRRGQWAAFDVDSDAYWHPCSDFVTNVDCTYDEAPGDGFTLGDDSGFGHLRGSVEYRVRVTSAGTYRVAYRVSTFAQTTDARIELFADGSTYTTRVHTNRGWSTISEPMLVMLPAGVQTIRLSVPPGGGGWWLNWFSLQRA